jgi:uncharacterized protein YbjT (DUF2867 family)
MDLDSPAICTVFGASGFVGTQVTQHLARHGFRVRAAVRRPDLAGHLRPLGDVGQIVPIQANVRNPDSIARAVHGASVVINLVAVGFQRGNQRFATVNVDGAGDVAEAAAAAGVKTFIHMSMLGADAESESAFARSRADGEAAVRGGFPGAIIMRPSLIFGPDDSYFNLMASLSRFFPVMPLIGGKSKFQPVYVIDVAEAFATAAAGNAKPGRTYELGGPEVVTQRELLQLILHEAGRSNPLLPLPVGIAKLMTLPMALLPKPLVTSDQVILLQSDNVVSDAAARERRTLQGLGITPTPMGEVLPTYLWRFRRNGQFDKVAV